MTDQPQSEQAIQAGAPTPIAPTPAAPPPEPAPPSSDIIPLPPLPPPPTLAPIDQGWSVFEVVLLLLVATLCFFLGSFAVTTSEFWLRLATGRAIAEGESLGVDPFSFASVQDGAPVPWINHSWLYDLGLYHLYTTFGGPGVVIVHAALMVALFFVLLNLRPEGSSRLSALLLAGLTVLVAGQRPLPNPMLISYVFIGLMLLLLFRGGALGACAPGACADEDKPRALWGLPLLFALWVNLDSWFFLGLVTLALIVVGNLAAGVLGWHGRDRPALQLAVLAASGAACLLNPYGWQVFKFPAEAAYALGAWLPRVLDGGAEALRGFEQADPELLRSTYFGPFHRNYLPIRPQTFVLASVAFFLLLSLSALAFVLRIVSGLAKNGSGIPVGRLLAWGLVAFLGVMQYRMIPLFAVVAGPLTMLNFAEFGRWRRSREGAEPAPIFHPGLARLVAAMLVLIAVGLAWPGWLHGRIGGPSSRRVAWHVREDPSLRAAAEALQRAEAKHVFNYSFDMANYCAWFAPGVRCYVDQRLALFPHEAHRYAKAKKALETNAADVLTEAPSSSARRDWSETFQRHAIDHLAMSKSIDAPEALIMHMCWLDPRHWIQEYLDGRGGVFAYSASGEGNPLALHEEMLREAFGPVPEERRAPRQMATMPETSALSLYLHGQPPVLSSNVTEPFIYHAYFRLIQQSWPRAYGHARLVGIWTASSPLGAAAPHGALLSLFLSPRPRARDSGPVAAPLLAIRQARRAVSEHPLEPRAHKALHQAYLTQAFAVEEYWAGGDKSERANVRRVQIATAYRTYLDLQPEDWQTRMEFAEFLKGDHLLDAALEQMKLAAQWLEKERLQTRDKRRADALKSQEKQLAQFNKKNEQEMKRRRTDFDIKAGRKKPFERFEVAVRTQYRTVDDRNQEIVDERGMGLALEGLKQLENVNLSELKPEEKTVVRYWRFRIRIQLGLLGDAGEELDFIEDPRVADQCRLWYVAALGDYELMDQTITRIEEMTERSAPLAAQRAKLREAVARTLFALSVTENLPGAARPDYSLLSLSSLMFHADSLRQIAAAHANSRTLRGLFALEAGDTAKAAELFAEALRMAGPDGVFADRAIAERYLELLRDQKR